MLESLEPRQLFSGVVTVTTNYGPEHRTLIKGDAGRNEIIMGAVFDNWIEQEDAYEYLTVYDSRLIVDGVEIPSGHSDLYTAPELREYDVYNYQENGDGTTFRVNDSPIFDLGSGDDVLRLEGDWDNAFRDVDIIAGDGNDRITADGGFQSLNINSGNGDDSVTVHGNSYANPVFYGVNGVVGDLEIATGQGKDRIALIGDDLFNENLSVLRIGGRLRISDNSGPTQVSIANVRTKRAATIALGQSYDTVAVANSFFGGETRFLTRGGNDVIHFRGKVVVPNIATALLLGPGGDTFDAERYYDDFVG